MITAHYDPKPSFIVQRFKFYNRIRATGESIAAFVASLCKIAEHCQYKDTLKDMLRDCLVCGVNHKGTQRKLLAEKNLTYEKALEITLTMETAEKGTEDLKAHDMMVAPKDIHYTPLSKSKQHYKAGTSKTQSTVTCYRCLGEHLTNACKFCTAECHLCKKVGHIAKACKSKQKNKKGNNLTPRHIIMRRKMMKPLHLQNTTEIQRPHMACLHLKAAAQTLLWFKLTSTRFLVRWKLTLVHHCLSSTKLPMTESVAEATLMLCRKQMCISRHIQERLCASW